MLLGYEITAAVYSSLILIIAFLAIERKGIAQLLRGCIDRYSLAALAAILIFFLVFSILFVSPVEQLYFDENIYQAIALNILNHGNALWCQFGTGYAQTCYVNAIYHDPVGWAAIIAIAFAVFGIGPQTAYGLELLVGLLSILFVFLLASLLFKRKSYAVLSALAFSLMPMLFIWSRTQADFDLPFMMLATLTFLFFAIFMRRKSLGSFALFAFSLDLVSYLRMEAILLVPIFAVMVFILGEKGIAETFRERTRLVWTSMQNNTRVLVLLFVFLLLLLPEVYYISLETQNPTYGQPANTSVLSLANFKANIGTNLSYLFGQINGISYYPTAFHYAITPLAILGAFALALDKKIRNRFGVLIMLLLWFAAYFGFYTSFYAGGATFGVDSRFFLQILPPLCLLAAYGILKLADLARFAFSSRSRNKTGAKLAFGSVAVVLTLVLLVFPFVQLSGNITLPPQGMPQQSVIRPALNLFYSNYKSVPQNCLVFSFTPDIWFEANRSSAQIGYLSGSNSTVKQEITQYSCYVLDYGYWCVVPPYHDTLCHYLLTKYAVQNLTSPAPPFGGSNVTFYRILNYT